MTSSFPILGFDIGGTKIAVSLMTSDGVLLASRRVPNQDRAPEEVLPELARVGRELLAQAGLSASDLRAIGADAPSPMDFANGVIEGPPNMKKWKHVPLKDFLQDSFGAEVFFDNDGNGSGLAEWLFGAGREAKNMIYLTLSTGIGGGVIVDGRLMRGASWMGGEVGHISIDPDGPLCNCGMRGCYEAFCGGRAIAQRLQRELADKPDSAIVRLAGGLENIDLKSFYAACKEGDSYALKVWDEMMERNAQAIGALLNIFNPNVVVLGTIAIHCADLFMPPLLERLPRYAWKPMIDACRIETGRLGSQLGEYAGACVALYALYERGEWSLPWQEFQA